MKSIYKYQISVNGISAIPLPINSTLLSCKVQRNEICIWFLVDVSLSEKYLRTFKCYCTGQTVDYEIDNQKFIDTCLLDNGEYIVHVFEIFL